MMCRPFAAVYAAGECKSIVSRMPAMFALSCLSDTSVRPWLVKPTWSLASKGCLSGCAQEAKARRHLLERQSEHPHLWGMNSADFDVYLLFCQ